MKNRVSLFTKGYHDLCISLYKTNKQTKNALVPYLALDTKVNSKSIVEQKGQPKL